jgi:hypothetical protein
MPKNPRQPKVSYQLRRLIKESGVSCYRIAKDTKVSKAALSRFLSGERGLSTKALDTLGDYFGWRVVATGNAKQK